VDYYDVISPSDTGALNIDSVKHTYLHFVLDPMVMKRPLAMQRLTPLLSSVLTAPMDESYKRDITLLVTESLIRAVEARTRTNAKVAADERLKDVAEAESEGFILTRYFYNALGQFEKGPVGLKDAFSDILRNIDVDAERKRAERIEFTARAPRDVLTPQSPNMLDQAEDKLAVGDLAAAQQFAQAALDQHQDAARADFILAKVATLQKQIDEARTYFQRVLTISREPRLVAWSHIYLGRISDLEDHRDDAVAHYRAALNAGDTSPDTKAAAERGLKQPPAHRQQDQEQ
jgi:tetratricopeptide (TPR) repeat protein